MGVREPWDRPRAWQSSPTRTSARPRRVRNRLQSRDPAGCYNQGRLTAVTGIPRRSRAPGALRTRLRRESRRGLPGSGPATPRKDRASIQRVVTRFGHGCDLGDDTSCFELGEMQRNRPSLGGEVAAGHLFQKACARNHADACERVGRLVNRVRDRSRAGRGPSVLGKRVQPRQRIRVLQHGLGHVAQPRAWEASRREVPASRAAHGSI